MKRPSSSDTASMSLSAALICLSTACTCGESSWAGTVRGEADERDKQGDERDDSSLSGVDDRGPAKAGHYVHTRPFCGFGSRVGDAVGDADAAEAGSRHEHTGMMRKASVDVRHQLKVPDFQLRARSVPPIHAAEFRRAADARARRSARAARFPTSSRSDFASTSGSRAPPRNARSSAWPSGARCGHFDEIQAPAVMFSPRSSAPRTRCRAAGDARRPAETQTRPWRSTDT